MRSTSPLSETRSALMITPACVCCVRSVSVQEVGAKSSLVKRSKIPKKFDWASQDLRPLAPGSVETIEFLVVDDLVSFAHIGLPACTSTQDWDID